MNAKEKICEDEIQVEIDQSDKPNQEVKKQSKRVIVKNLHKIHTESKSVKISKGTINTSLKKVRSYLRDKTSDSFVIFVKAYYAL